VEIYEELEEARKAWKIGKKMEKNIFD